MQKRKFDELISLFNRKVSEMSIEQKYKMELLGMISAIGFAHEKELGTNLAEVGTDCISRQSAIDALAEYGNGRAVYIGVVEAVRRIDALPPAEPIRGKWIRDGHHIRCDQCGIYMCDTDREGDRIPTNFCPNCGADMREVTT